MARPRRQDVLAREIGGYEQRFDSWNRNSGLWLILAYARKEWVNGNYDQCYKCLSEMRLIVKNLGE